MKKSTIKDKLLLDLLSWRLWLKGYKGNKDSISRHNINMLLNEKCDYDDIHPILLNWMYRFSKDSYERGVVVRLLGDAKDIEYVKVLLDEYEGSEDLDCKFIVANSIYMINKYDDSTVKQVIGLIKNRNGNNARQPLLKYLFNSGNEKAIKILEELYSNGDETKTILKTLKYLLDKKYFERKINPACKRAIMVMEK